MVLSCLPGASLSKGIQSVLGSRPWRPPQDLPRTGPFAIEIVLKVRQNPAPFQNRDSIGDPVHLILSCLPGALQADPIDPFLPPWCLPGCPNGSFLPPWCLPGASQTVQLILSCLSGASQAVQLILSCLPGASQAVLKISNLKTPDPKWKQRTTLCNPGGSNLKP